MKTSRHSVKRRLAPSKKSNRTATSPKKTRASKARSASSTGRTVKARIRTKTGRVRKFKNIRNKRVKPKALKDIKFQLGNRLVHALDAVSFRNKNAVRTAVQAADHPLEL